jgi:hypothetical protein
MIEITKQSAFIIYLAFTLGIVLFLWLLHGAQRSRRYLFDYKEEEFTCPTCGCTYLFPKHGPVDACPACNESKVKKQPTNSLTN